MNKNIQEYADIGAAPFFISGVLGTLICVFLGFTFGTSSDFATFALFIYSLLLGPVMLLVGIGVMKRWRFIWIPALALCVLGLPNFPIGTLLYGWAIYGLWKARGAFFPFAKSVDAEQGAAANP